MAVEPVDERLILCQETIRYTFSNPDILRLALTHSSDKSPERNHPALDNERLEFLGDSVLGVVVCEKLFSDYPEFAEGELTAIKSVVVSRATLARVSIAIGLPRFMWLGKGLGGHEHLPSSLCANIFEAIVGALYLDGGLQAARDFIVAHLSAQIKLVEANQHQRNYKSLLQHYAQKELGITPTYRVIAEAGPDHVKEFEVVAIIGSTEYATGKGKSKKDAEQRAAEQTFLTLSQSTPNTPPSSAESDPAIPEP